MNVLVDTSVWIRHFRQTEPGLVRLLEAGRVMTHAFVRGELACGNLPKRRDTLQDLARIPTLPTSPEAEVMTLIEHRNLMGKGLGYIDVHLLATVLVASPLPTLWTLDRRLSSISRDLGVVYDAEP